jgi:sialidase-1
VAELSDGSLLLNMRDNRNRADKSSTNGRAMAVTRDLGASWTVHPADHGALPEPVCMASMISHRLPDGRHVLFFSNPRHKHARRDMTVQVSFDDGRTWPARHHLLLDARGGAYSSLVMVDDSTLGILYESSQADLVFQRIPLKRWLLP